MLELTPRKIVAELDKYIVGQNDAKRAVAIAIRNRWRRHQVEPEMKKEIGPKNMMMIGPTGVGKTEIARRLAALTGAPFIKVEATKYTEVGYYGRDVESMVRDLVENALGIVRTEERKKIEDQARKAAEERIASILEEVLRAKLRKDSAAVPGEDEEDEEALHLSSSEGEDSDHSGHMENSPNSFINMINSIGKAVVNVKDSSDPDLPNKNPALFIEKMMDELKKKNPDIFEPGASSPDSQKEPEKPEESELIADREEILRRLRAGEYEETLIPVVYEQKTAPPVIMGGIGLDNMDTEFQSMFENIFPKRSNQRELPVKEARDLIFEQECDRLLNKENLNSKAIDLAENLGIIFIDEIDKIVASDQQHGADVSRQGVQRDMLPIVEGTTIQTKYGLVSTEHILFIAAGAFHRSKPTDLMPELQGRFPIRVELSDLSKDDFICILKDPHGALTKQYTALMKTEGVDLSFTDDAIAGLAQYAHDVNQTTQNIGARRLYTIMERLLEELSFEAPDMKMGKVVVNGPYVAERLGKLVQDEDLSKFIL
ncbi:MAG: ATP-dependent protease ATPase subunit HslU [Planctomycetia bacterium]|nr:ATP-dependent protease ATPase subunit HslU [Planctomycetia bacterium]